MVLQLKQDKTTGQYVVDYGVPDVTKPAVTAGEFEAYSGLKDQTTLVGGTTLGEQTQKVMREAPGQVTTEIDPETGEVKTKTTGQQVELEQKPITSLETKTGTAAMPETALEKAMRFASMTGPTQQNQFDPNEYFNRIESIQKDAQKAQLTNTLIKGGLDIGMTYLRGKLGGFSTGGIVQTPLSGGAFPGTSFMGAGGAGSTLMGAGIAGGAGYGLGKLIGAKESESKGMGAGAAIGYAVGGPIGGVIGGAIGGVFGCFLPDTKITMADGSEKEIINVKLNDRIKIGGRVFATGQFLINNLYDYKGVKVSGSHMVNENDTWLRVEDSKLAKSLGNDEHIVYTLGTDNRRILIDNILFTDYFEVDEQKELVSEGNKYFNNWKIHSNQLQDENVNIMNAS